MRVLLVEDDASLARTVRRLRRHTSACQGPLRNWPIFSRNAALLGTLASWGASDSIASSGFMPERVRRRRLTRARVVGIDQELFLARPRLLDVDRRPEPALGQLAVEDELHVAGALELLEDQLVHPAAGLDQGGRQHGEEPPSSKSRAAPKRRLGTSMALMSIPPDIVRPELDPLL